MPKETYTYRAGKKLKLTKPNVPAVDLHSREGRDADDIQHVYTVQDEPKLGAFVGQPAVGEWRLKVSDHANRDVGKLNRWVLSIR